MSSYETLRYEESGDIARVWLNRSRITMKMINELTAVCDHLEDVSQAKVVVFRGSTGDFCGGIDFEDFKPDAALDIHGFNRWEKLIQRIERLPKITVAALEGAVIGGGFQLALVMDARVASPGARLQLNEVHLGFLPGMATFRLAKYVGMGRARKLIMRCQILDAAEAADLGLVDDLCEDVEQGIAQTIAEFGPLHTVVVELGRRLLNECFSHSYEDAIGNFLAAQHRAIQQTAFLDTLKKHRDNRQK